MVTSDEVLSDPIQPKDVVFIGGGVISMEFGHVYQRAGSNVTILEVMPQLLPLATCEGRTVGENTVNAESATPDYRVIPGAVYTVPAFATVGLTEAEARDRGLKLRVAVNDIREWFSGKSYAETVAWAKVIVDEDTDQVVGAHLVGHRGEELIHTFSLAMQHGISATALKGSFFAFPSFSSDIKNLLG